MEDFTEDQKVVVNELIGDAMTSMSKVYDPSEDALQDYIATYLEKKGLITSKFVPGWYKSSHDDKYLMYWASFGGPSYGLSASGIWNYFEEVSKDDIFSKYDHLSLAGYDFVRDTLISETKRRGYGAGVLCNNSNIHKGDYRDCILEHGRKLIYELRSNSIEWNDGPLKGSYPVFRNGIWAEIVEKPEKIEKKSSENELPDVFDSFDNLITSVQQWSIDKGIDKAAPEKQFLKVIEETGEIASALAKSKPKEELMDALGDTFVTLIILSQQLNLDPKECLQMAYDIISKRTGKTVDGVFVKSEDLVK